MAITPTRVLVLFDITQFPSSTHMSLHGAVCNIIIIEFDTAHIAGKARLPSKNHFAFVPRTRLIKDQQHTPLLREKSVARRKPYTVTATNYIHHTVPPHVLSSTPMILVIRVCYCRIRWPATFNKTPPPGVSKKTQRAAALNSGLSDVTYLGAG